MKNLLHTESNGISTATVNVTMAAIVTATVAVQSGHARTCLTYRATQAYSHLHTVGIPTLIYIPRVVAADSFSIRE